MIDFAPLLRRLNECEVDYIIVGGVAASVHGVARATFDLDVVYSRETENVVRLEACLGPLSPYLRTSGPSLPLRRRNGP